MCHTFGAAMQLLQDILEDLLLVAFVLAIAVSLCASQGCAKPKHSATQTPYWQKDIDPGCETASDWGDSPYDTYHPCHVRSTTKI